MHGFPRKVPRKPWFAPFHPMVFPGFSSSPLSQAPQRASMASLVVAKGIAIAMEPPFLGTPGLVGFFFSFLMCLFLFLGGFLVVLLLFL